MKINKTTTLTFSATENSKKTALAIATGMGLPVAEIDCTDRVFAPARTSFGMDEAVVFCAPVYTGRIPPAALDRLATFKGDNTPAVVTVSYGNRDYDDALLELLDTVVANGFVPVVAGAFIGQHTFGTIAIGRPDANDLAQAAQLGAEAMRRIDKAADISEVVAPAVKGNRPYKAYSPPSYTPVVNASVCVKCGECANKCPVAAISLDAPSQPADTVKCMACFRCVRVCPTGARNLEFEAYQQFAAMITQRLAEPRKENELLL